MIDAGRKMTRPTPRLLLVGGGHAHLEVVRRLAGHRDVSATLVNAGRYATYSGMLPGLIAGHYSFEEAHVDLDGLCRRSNVGFVSARVTGIRPDQREAECDDGVRRGFDVVSIDTGSTPRMSDVPGAREHAVAVKPVAHFLARWEHALASRQTSDGMPIDVVVVGGGAGGVELVLAMHHRLAGSAQTRQAQMTRFTLISESLLPGHAPRVQDRVRVILSERGIALARGRVARVTASVVHTSDGRALPAQLAIFATRASAPEWLAASGLATDSLGFIAVDSHFQSVSHAGVFAAGDVATNLADPAPKSGVHAVRAGPLLFENLRAVLWGRRPTAVFERQHRTLALIASGDRHATLSYGPIGLSGRWLWRWKDRIDRRFVARYRAR